MSDLIKVYGSRSFTIEDVLEIIDIMEDKLSQVTTSEVYNEIKHCFDLESALEELDINEF